MTHVLIRIGGWRKPSPSMDHGGPPFRTGCLTHQATQSPPHRLVQSIKDILSWAMHLERMFFRTNVYVRDSFLYDKRGIFVSFANGETGFSRIDKITGAP